MPMGPAPEINTSSPIKSYVSAVCTALPNGSKKAAISDGISLWIGHTFDSGITKYSANAPLR